jgi:hypothetical protein
LLLRPEKIEFANLPGHVPLLTAKVLTHRFAGAWSEWELEGEGVTLLTIQANRAGFVWPQVGNTVDLFVAPEDVHVL